MPITRCYTVSATVTAFPRLTLSFAPSVGIACETFVGATEAGNVCTLICSRITRLAIVRAFTYAVTVFTAPAIGTGIYAYVIRVTFITWTFTYATSLVTEQHGITATSTAAGLFIRTYSAKSLFTTFFPGRVAGCILTAMSARNVATARMSYAAAVANATVAAAACYPGITTGATAACLALAATTGATTPICRGRAATAYTTCIFANGIGAAVFPGIKANGSVNATAQTAIVAAALGTRIAAAVTIRVTVPFATAAVPSSAGRAVRAGHCSRTKERY